MCGRFTQHMTWAQIHALYTIHEQPPSNLQPRYNVAPTQTVLAVRLGDRGRETFLPRWGLVPGWAKDLTIGARMINARAEGVAEKPAFRSAFRRRRCLIPADGFYEWTLEDKVKQPHYIYSTSGELLSFAGLWETWRDPAEPDAPPIETCTIVTAEASADVAALHDRMPVILPPVAWDVWLDPDAPASLLQDVLRPAPPGTLRHHRVDRRVGSPRNEGPELIEAIV